MPDSTQFDQLAALVAKLGERRQQFEVFRKLIEPLLQGSLDPVEGERRIFADLETSLETAFKLFASLSATNQASVLDEIETHLDDVIWEAASDLMPELDAKGKGQDRVLREVVLDLRGWDSQLVDLANVVDGARLDGAPFLDLESKLSAARSGAASIRSALTDRIYGGLKALRESAQSQMQQLDSSVKTADPQIRRVKKLVKQADLLIMQVATEKDSYEYRVLLRSADRFQTRGINIIQDVRPLSKKDREWMKVQLDLLTKGVNQGRIATHARKFNLPRTVLPAEPETATKAPAEESMRTLARLGDFMFRMIIPEQIQTYLRKEGWSFSITTNDLELPWELMCFEGLEPNEKPSNLPHLCVERSISRMPLGRVFPPVPSRRGPRPPKRRMLLIHSDPDNTLSKAAEEVETIARDLKDQLDFVRVSPADATNANLNDILMTQSFDFIHYAGHAYFDIKFPNESGLQLSDSILTARKIRLLNKGGSLVFLNACDSGTVASDSEPQKVSYLLTNPEPVVGLASAFVYSGALGCVGSLWPVYDTPAAELAVKFYRYVLSGEPTGEALRLARMEIRQSYPDEITWAAYVLYGDPTFRLTET
jgi:CHAT domain